MDIENKISDTLRIFRIAIYGELTSDEPTDVLKSKVRLALYSVLEDAVLNGEIDDEYFLHCTSKNNIARTHQLKVEVKTDKFHKIFTAGSDSTVAELIVL